jgi:hypothetical protein
MNTVSNIQEGITNMLSVGAKGSGFDSVTLPLPVAGEEVLVCTTPDLVDRVHPGVHEPPVTDDAIVGESEEVHTSFARARGILRGLKLILAHHGASQSVIDSFETQAMAYLDVESEATFFKRAKYLTVAPMARYLECEAPKQPDLAWSPIGQYRNWAKTRLRVFSRKNTHLWYSFLQGKRCALPLSSDLVLTTYKEHREAMDRPDPIDDETHDRVMKELKPVLEKIRQTLQSVYSTAGREDDWITPEETHHVASTKASYEKSRAGGGQLGALLRTVPQLQKCNPLNHVRSVVGRRDPDLVRMVFYPRAVISGRVELNVVIEEYEYPGGESEWFDNVRKTCVSYAAEQRTLKATIQAVLEPLKVRVISKGNAGPYYASKRLQKALHDVLRGMDCFRLIGQPLGATDLYDLAVNSVQVGTGRDEWFSIDYSAATDKLSARLSASILGFLLENQDPAMVNLWQSVLAPHMCEYPFPYDESVLPVQQRNGQLMGSVLSFPILCIANLGLYLSVIAKDPRPLSEKLKGVLVNGDDMLYVAPRSLWDDHVALGRAVGLEMSPGKAYHHPVYANANSACYHFDLSRFNHVDRYEDTDLLIRGPRRRGGGEFWWTAQSQSSSPYYIPFLNVGLFFGQNKVLGNDTEEEEQAKSYTSVIDRLLSGALPGKACDILAMYLKRHKSQIKEETENGMRNLFLPISHGGMGITKPDGWKSDITLLQRVMAYQSFRETPYAIVSELPLERQHLEGSLKEAPQPLRAPWLANQSEDGGFEPVLFRSRFTKNAGRAKRTLSAFRNGGELPRVMSDTMLRFPAYVTSTARPGVAYIARHPTPGLFNKKTQRDWFNASIDEAVEEEERTICSGSLEQTERECLWDLMRAHPRTFSDVSLQYGFEGLVRVRREDALEPETV